MTTGRINQVTIIENRDFTLAQKKTSDQCPSNFNDRKTELLQRVLLLTRVR
jgi:hypothetical protein